MNTALPVQLQQLQNFFASGATRDYAFRRQQLEKLKACLLKYENELYEALYKDLRKSPEESWVTETGFVIAELNHTLRNLKKWIKPQKVRTNLFNFPSRSFIYKEPLGLVLIIGPWNYPLQLLLAPLIGAMAAGNCIVLKPSEWAPATAALIRKMMNENFPEDYILYVEGKGEEVVPELMNSARFDHVFYTGGIEVGKIIYGMAAKQLTPVTLELGGKTPCVVEADANIRVAAKRIAVTKFSNAGQMCVAPDYVLVHRSVKESFVNALVKSIEQFYSEESKHSYNYGKIINDRQFNRLKEYLSHGRIIYGGQYDEASHHLEPTLLEEVPLDSVVMGEEIFGPVLPIISFESFEEAKAIINLNPEPLAFYVFTGSDAKEKRWLEEIPFGGGCVNNASWHLTNYHLPFGGRGNSGIGSYHGAYSFDLFSHQKSIMKTPTWFDPSIKYPPFKGKLSLFRKIIR